jgi:hypothetical protein
MRGGTTPVAVALTLALAAAGCGGLPEVEPYPTAEPHGSVASPVDTTDADGFGDTGEAAGSRNMKRSATVRTAFDTYIVRNVSFDTGEGFGSSQGLNGFYNGTLWEFKLRFVERLDVIGTVDAAEALTAPQNYFVREEKELKRTFRTRLLKTDGETVEFIVRINAIQGELESGGPLLLSIDELETLRRIEFF